MKIIKKDWAAYGEIEQVNPLRWQLLYRHADDSYEEQSALLKCKDFFNDVVAFLQKEIHFNMYGFSNKVRINEEGMYIMLYNIADKELFAHNLTVLNERVEQDIGWHLYFEDVEEEGMLLICIPPPLWESTYAISLVSMLIRCCNYNFLYNEWDDFFAAKAPINANEHAFDAAAKSLAQSHGFVCPKPGEWTYSVGGYDSEKVEKSGAQLKSIIHNNGVRSWAMAIEKEAVCA